MDLISPSLFSQHLKSSIGIWQPAERRIMWLFYRQADEFWLSKAIRLDHKNSALKCNNGQTVLVWELIVISLS